MRARFIREKFSKDSDPIHDMGIGIMQQIEKDVNKFGGWTCRDIYDYAYRTYCSREFDKYSTEIVRIIYQTILGISLSDLSKVSIEDIYKKVLHSEIYTSKNLNSNAKRLIKEKTKEILRKRYHIIIDENKLHEKFEKESDPIKDMDIGLMHEIRKFCKSKYPENSSKEDFLVTCAQYEKLDYVKYLLNKGIDIHVNDNFPLRWAAANGRKDVVKLLLDAGANVHAKDDMALRWAAANGHKDVVKLLLDAGANVHAGNDYALQLAAIYGHKDVVKLLLDAGANVHAWNDYALQLAVANGHKDTVKVLKDHIAKENLKK